MKICIHKNLVLFFLISIISLDAHAFDRKEKKLQQSLYLKEFIACVHKMSQLINKSSWQAAEDNISICKTAFEKIDHVLEQDKPNLMIKSLSDLELSVKKRDSKLLSNMLDQVDHIKSELINLFEINIAPALSPDLHEAKIIYKKYCSSCHGSEGKGDGVLSKKLPQRPSNFTSDAFRQLSSPMTSLNTLLIGVKDTPMPSFAEHLSLQDIWSLSFYLQTLSWESHAKDKTSLQKKQFDFSGINYSILATNRDYLLEKILLEKNIAAKNELFEALYILRVLAPYNKETSRFK